nr:AAA domain-containing protein [uncultured Romboutsia sp.]
MIKYIGNDRYKVIEKIGNGIMTEVFLCRVFGEDYDEAAIKVYIKKDKDELSEHFFERECEVLGMLRHENIVRLLDKGYDQEIGAYYIALEYVDGKTLGQIIKHKKVSLDYAENVISQIFNALEYSHNNGILHRDIKPSNIMIDRSGNVKVIDFGISKIIESLSQDYTVVHAMTPKYASPEQRLGKTLNYSSDIYSLGLLIYEVLSGKEYNTEDNIEELIKNNHSISEDKKRILIKMTQFDSEKRYKNIYEVKKDWNKSNKLNESYYCLKISKSSIDKLKDLGMIDSPNEISARELLGRDLDGDTYISKVSNIYTEDKTGRFFIWGKQVELICAIDKVDSTKLSIVGVSVPNTFFLEKNKEDYGMLVDYKWKITSKEKGHVPIEKLLNKYNEFDIKLKMENKNDILSNKLFEKWEKILDIHKDINNKSRKTLRYTSLNYDESNRKLYLTISNQYRECEFNEEQLLVLTSKATKYKNSFRTQKAGYYAGFKNGVLEIDLLREVTIDMFAKSGEVSVDLSYLDSLIDRQQRALKKIKSNQAINENIKNILINPEMAKGRYFAEKIEYANKYIDQSKQYAVCDALSSKDIYLLQGPPGTGKTTFISEIVNQTLKYNPKAKILISSQSNVAVNHAMNKVKELIPDITMVRLGRSDKISNGIESYALELQLDSWIDEIKAKCERYFEVLKKKNVDQEAIEKYYLLDEVQQLRSKLEELATSINKANKDITELEYEYKNILSYKSEIDKITEKLNQIISKGYNKAELSIMDSFKEQYVKIGEDFIKNIANANKIGKEKEELQEQKTIMEIEYKKVKEELQAGKEILGVSHDTEIETIKEKLDIKFKNIKKKIDQINRYERIKKEWINSISHSAEIDKLFIEDISIIGATCIGIANYSEGLDLKFDLVIVDEAGRATPPEIMVPMSIGKKIILVGDHKQLPPIIDQILMKEIITKTDLSKKDLEESLFAYLQKNMSEECKGSLTEQYRMHPAIGKLISGTFYNNTIKSGSNTIDKKHGYDEWKDSSIVWIDTKNNVERFEQDTFKTKQNQLEANLIFELLLKLENEYKLKGIKNKDVGVICGYSGQKVLLNKLFYSRYKDYFTVLNVEIDTVDAFQGRETDIVIYSIVRSNQEGNIGFLSDARRLNVALSRAKELLIIVGDSQCVTSKVSNNMFREIYEYITINEEECKIIEV